MSDAPTQEPTTQPPPQEPAEEEPKEEEESEVKNGEDKDQLYDPICAALDTERAADETIEEFKIRVVTEFSDMEAWPDAKYETLPKDVQDWVYDATITHKSNTNKKRKKALPMLTGLDQLPVERLKRASLVDEPKKAARAKGDDCLTRTMKILLETPEPDKVKAADLVKSLEAKYGKAYSTAAVRYAQQAFTTARRLFAEQPNPAAA